MMKLFSAESRTEAYCRDQLKSLGWDLKTDVLEKQEIRNKYPKYLKKPEYVLLLNGSPVAVIECKANYQDIQKAEQEANNYAHDLNIPIAIGVAGNESTDALVESYYKNKRIVYKKVPLTQLLTKEYVTDLLREDSHIIQEIRLASEKNIYQEAEYISNQFRGAHVDKKDMSRYLSCFILGLFYEKDMVMAMRQKGNASVINQLLNRIESHLDNQPDVANVLKIHNPQSTVIEDLMNAFPKIISSLRRLDIEAVMQSGQDIIGVFFENFLRYSNDKKDLGIVFTPRHIVRFMCEIIDLESNDKILDPCCGTGGFLVTAFSKMRNMIEQESSGNILEQNKRLEDLKNNSIFGIESETSGEIAALAVVNMIIRGDGKSNIIQGSCFDAHPGIKDNFFDKILLNPPYSQKKNNNMGRSEEEFLDCSLAKLKKGGKLCAIIPYSVLSSGKWKNILLKKHTIEAVFSVPIDLFYPVSMPTLIVLIKAHIPQNNAITFLGRINDDGYVIDRKKRTKISDGDIKDMLEVFKYWAASKKEISSPKSYIAIKLPINSTDEYVPEKYLESDINVKELSMNSDKVIRSQLCFQVAYSPNIRNLLKNNRKTSTSNFIKRGVEFSFKNKLLYDWQDIFYSKSEIMKKFLIKGIKIKDDNLACMYGDRELHDKSWLKPGEDIIISSGGTDNGLYGFYNYKNAIGYNFSISQNYNENAMITCASAGTIGSAFVQEINFSACDSTLIFFPKPHVDVELLYYICALLRINAWRFRYGRQMTPERITEHLKIDASYYEKEMISTFRNELPYIHNLKSSL